VHVASIKKTCLAQCSWVGAELGSVQGREVRGPERPAVVRASEHDVAQLRLEHVLFVLLLLLPTAHHAYFDFSSPWEQIEKNQFM